MCIVCFVFNKSHVDISKDNDDDDVLKTMVVMMMMTITPLQKAAAFNMSNFTSAFKTNNRKLHLKPMRR